MEIPREDALEKLLPDVLKELWDAIDEKKLTVEQFHHEEEQRLEGYKRIWKNALILKGRRDLKQSLLWELGSYFGIKDLAKVERQCKRATATAKREWKRKVQPRSRQSVEQYYEESKGTLYELMWWHTLEWDNSPLAYITALQFAQQHGCGAYLDFGAGAGSGAIVFARQGFQVALADISPSLLRFDRWRFELRRLPAQYFDLKSVRLPDQAFDFATGMDVFEHLYDPPGTAEDLWRALRPGGFLFGRFGTKEDENSPQHIIKDFGPMFQRMRELGFVEVWKDEWLWGHQVFQKT